MFKKVNRAYEVLGDQKLRRKYDAGLILEASLTQSKSDSWTLKQAPSFWRPPLRCGFILVEGISSLGRFLVEKILAWEDVTNDRGEIMVTSWPAGADHFITNWV